MSRYELIFRISLIGILLSISNEIHMQYHEIKEMHTALSGLKPICIMNGDTGTMGQRAEVTYNGNSWVEVGRQ